MKKILVLVNILIFTALFLAGCGEKKTVTVYTSVDQIYSEELFKMFEQETKIKVNAVYDIEASKTVGLANRLIAEKDNPSADLFWSGEPLQTMRLIDEGVVEADRWEAFGGRARVFLYHKSLIDEKDMPIKIADLADAKRFGKEGYAWGIAFPMFGTTSTHAAAIYSMLGEVQGRKFFETIYDQGVTSLEGNSVVKDFVNQKKLAFGLTDTDDAYEAMQENKDLAILFPDQDDIGTLVVPNTLAFIKGGKNAEEARKFQEFLHSEKAKSALIKSGWFDERIAEIKVLDVDWQDVYKNLEKSKNDMTEIFSR